MDKSRIEALSDGVFAVAITLLALDIHVPLGSMSNAQLWLSIRHVFPGIVAYIFSFCIIGIFWNGHHTIFRFTKLLNRPLIWLNLLYLMVVAFMPFPTALLAEHYTDQAAIVLYSMALISIGLLHFILLNYIYGNTKLAQEWFTQIVFDRSRLASLFGAGCGVLAVMMSFVWPPGSLLMLALVPIYYIFLNRAREGFTDVTEK